MNDPTWRDRAACVNEDPELFFREDAHSTTAAKTVCASCPVADMCLEYAMNETIQYGVYGGLTAKDANMTEPVNTIRNILWPTRAGIPLPPRECERCSHDAEDGDRYCTECIERYERIWNNPDQHHDTSGDN